MLYTPSQVCAIYKCSPTTLKNWCELAKPFLSAHATPERGRHRYFQDSDLAVIGVIATSPDYDTAYLALSNGQRSSVPETATDLVSSAEKQKEIVALQSEIMRLEAELESEKERRIEAEGQVKLLRDLLKEAMGKG
jgi:uncharacterized small protein (DUF1192 family)